MERRWNGRMGRNIQTGEKRKEKKTWNGKTNGRSYNIRRERMKEEK